MWPRIRREIRRYRRALPRLRRLAWHDVGDLVRAQAALLRAQWELRARPTGAMVREEPAVPAAAAAGQLEQVRRIALSVNRAAAFGLFRPRCLVRSMALRRLLDHAQIQGAIIRFGVQLRHGVFAAHAWVEYGGQVVGDDPEHVARYLPMTGMQVAELE